MPPTADQRAKRRDAYLRSTYGVTEQEYQMLLRLQQGVCWICHRPPKARRLSVDHRHTKGERKLPTEQRRKLIRANVRGLLCSFCNRGLQVFRDKAELFSRAAQYLTTWPAKEVISE